MRFFVRAVVLPVILSGSFLWGDQLNKLGQEINALYEDISPSIVSIHYGEKGKKDLVGTGVVIDKMGNMVTVMRFLSGRDIWVETAAGEELRAELRGVDSETGVAVLKVKRPLKAVELCDLNTLSKGDILFVVGNSFGLMNGISISLYSGRRENGEYLQLGNSVLPGNSGAGVFNVNGELVGIVSFALKSGFDMGISESKSVMKKEIRLKMSPELGFSVGMMGPGVVIPADRMMDLAREIIEKGKVERGWLGVFIKENAKGVAVTGVVEDSPAKKSRIKEGDVITKYGEKQVKDLGSFIDMVKNTKPGEKVQVYVLRKKKTLKFEVKIGERPSEEKKFFRLKKLIPPVNIFSENSEMEKIKLEIRELKKQLEDTKKKLKKEEL